MDANGTADRLRMATAADVWGLECRMAALWADAGQPWTPLSDAKAHVATVAEGLVLASLVPVMAWARTNYPHLFEQ